MEGGRCVPLLPWGQGPVWLGTADKRQLERMAEKRRPRLPQGLRQRAKVTGHLLRYLVCVREVLLKEFVVRVIMICTQDRKDTREPPDPAERSRPSPCLYPSRSSERHQARLRSHPDGPEPYFIFFILLPAYNGKNRYDCSLSYSSYFHVFFECLKRKCLTAVENVANKPC